MTSKSLTVIVVLALVALACFGVAAHMLSDSSPKVKVKVAIERDMPRVRLRAIETVRDEATSNVTQRVHLEPRDEASPLVIEDLEEAGERAARVMMSPDLPLPIRLDALEVRAPGGLATPVWSRHEVEQRAAAGELLRAVSMGLATDLGFAAVPRFRLLGTVNAYGVGIPERPPGNKPDEVIVATVCHRFALGTFVEVPAKEVGKAPVRIQRRK